MAKWPDKPISTPYHDPVYSEKHMAELNGESGIIFKDARMLCHIFTVKDETLRDFLPPELKPAPGKMAAAYVAEYPCSSLGAFKQAALMLECEFEGTAGFHVAYMYVDAMYGDHTLGADRALIAAREGGYPVTLANIDLFTEGEQMLGCVSRQGMEIMRIEADDISIAGNAPKTPDVINIRAIPNTEMTTFLHKEVCCYKTSAWPKFTRLGSGSIFFPASNDLIRDCGPLDNKLTYFTIFDSCLHFGKTLKVL